MTDQYERWQATTIRRPGDVPPAVPMSWQVERHGYHANGETAEDALAVLALRESIRRDVEAGRGVRLRDAMERGATWLEAAAALDVPLEDARELLETWAQGQHRLYRQCVEEGRHPFGLDAEQHAAVLELCALGDGERTGGTCTEDCSDGDMCTGTAPAPPAL